MPTTEIIISALTVAATALIQGLVAYFLSRTLHKQAARKDAEFERKREIEEKERKELHELRIVQERKERVEDVKSVLVPIELKIDKIDNRLKHTADGTLASLRNDILKCYYECYDKGYRNDYDYQDVHDLYEAYKELDGNSFIDNIMVRFDALPTEEEFERAQKKQRRKKSVRVKTEEKEN